VKAVGKWINQMTLTLPMKMECVLGSPHFSTSSTSFTLAGRLIFPGSSSVGSPKKIKVIAWGDNGITAEVRVYDSTNGATIAQLTINNTVAGIKNLGTLSAIPNAEGIWEVQIRRASGSGTAKVYIGFVGVYF
jgi:hypothetical protein